MRFQTLIAVALLVVPQAALAAPIPCSDLPQADKFVHEKLQPGPNTTEALRHLALAKAAKTEQQCSDELAAVDAFARKSLAADKAAAPQTGH